MHSRARRAFTPRGSPVRTPPTSATINCCSKSSASSPLEKRTAHYVCHATLSDPDGNIRAESEGYCSGRIRHEYAGSGGFGYDPLFEIVEYHRTFGELGPAVKAALSHRARAIRELIPAMLRLVDAGEWK